MTGFVFGRNLHVTAFLRLQVQEEGNKAVIEALQQAGVLLKQERYQHKYPYDWRTKKPTIFRATDQVGIRALGGAVFQVLPLPCSFRVAALSEHLTVSRTSRFHSSLQATKKTGRGVRSGLG